MGAAVSAGGVDVGASAVTVAWGSSSLSVMDWGVDDSAFSVVRLSGDFSVMDWGVDDSALSVVGWGVNDSTLAVVDWSALSMMDRGMDDSALSMMLSLDENLNWFQRFAPTHPTTLSIRATDLIFL